MKIKVVGQAEVTGDESELPYAHSQARSKRFIITEHGKNQLQWNIPPRTWNTENDTNADAFDQINMYFASLDEATQSAIFAKYQEIHNVLRATNMHRDEIEDLVEAIRPIAQQLFSYIDPTRFYNWVWSTLRPTIPASAASVNFDPNTMPGTRERTYLLEDYKGLIPLAIVVRLASPFWFDFTALTKSVLSREHKDQHAYGLIEQAWPAQSPAMSRLEEFIDHTVGNDRNNPAAILLGIGTDDFVYWVLSGMVVNKLPTVDVMGTNPAMPVVSALYSFVRTRVTTIGSSMPAIKNKFAETSYAADENNQSYLEGFRNRIALTVGQEAVGDYYLERQLDMIREGKREEFTLLERVAPGIDYALVEDALRSTKSLYDVVLSEEQINLAAWLFHPYSQVRTVGNLLLERVVSLLALAQAVLLHHGKIDLAILVTAGYERVDNTSGTLYLGESISQVRATDREQYRALFPLEQRSRNQKKIKNFVFDDVFELVRSLQEYDINCTFSEETLRRIQGNNPNRKYFLKKDAVTMVMDYAKWLAERPIVRIDPMAVYQKLLGKHDGSVLTTAISTGELAGNY